MLSLLAGCNWCPDGYRACAGQCWMLIDQNVPFWTAASLCEAESTKISGGNPSYIAIPSPRDSAEDICVYDFSGGNGVWLGYILQVEYRTKWLDYRFRNYLSYSPWASGQPNIWGWPAPEYHVVLIPTQGWGGLNSGWHDCHPQGPFRTLCATRWCIQP